MTVRDQVSIAGVPWPVYKVLALAVSAIVLVIVAVATASAAPAVLAAAAAGDRRVAGPRRLPID